MSVRPPRRRAIRRLLDSSGVVRPLHREMVNVHLYAEVADRCSECGAYPVWVSVKTGRCTGRSYCAFAEPR